MISSFGFSGLRSDKKRYTKKSPELNDSFRAFFIRNQKNRYTSSFIQTILSVLELHQIVRHSVRGLYRRSGITPCPEDCIFNIWLHNTSRICSCKVQRTENLTEEGTFSPDLGPVCRLSSWPLLREPGIFLTCRRVSSIPGDPERCLSDG